MTEQEARDALPPDARWSCSFGNPGEERYSEFWRDAAGRRTVLKKDGPTWSVEELA